MGLDSVELVMEIEDCFEIDLSGAAAATGVTIGDLADLVHAQLAAEGRPREREAVLAMVMVITCDQLGTTLDGLTEQTRFIEDLGLA